MQVTTQHQQQQQAVMVGLAAVVPVVINLEILLQVVQLLVAPAAAVHVTHQLAKVLRQE